MRVQVRVCVSVCVEFSGEKTSLSLQYSFLPFAEKLELYSSCTTLRVEEVNVVIVQGK